MSLVGVIAAALLGAMFLAAGVAKLVMGPAWPVQARDMGAPALLVPVVPWFEIVLGALLVVQFARPVMSLVALGVLVVFTVLIAVRLAQGRRPACACFGSVSAQPIGPMHLVRNGFFIAVALLAALA